MGTFQLEDNSKNKGLLKIIGVNILIFFLYFGLGITIFKLKGETSLDQSEGNGTLIVNYAFIFHVLILLILSFFPSTIKSKRMRHYLVSMFFVILFGIGGIVFLWMIDPTAFTMF
jgi:hypothetical protein